MACSNQSAPMPPRRRHRSAALSAAIAAGLAAVASLRALAPTSLAPAAVPPQNDGVPAAAFVASPAPRTLLMPRLLDRDAPAPRTPDVAMHGGTRKLHKYYMKKKSHVSNWHRRIEEVVEKMNPQRGWQLSGRPPIASLEKWSQTLKLTFAEGEDDVVTEEEVIEHFTTGDYKPEAVVVGHKAAPHETVKHAYVHFATREECRQARQEKKTGSIGKASEYKVVYTDEKKWVRVRDGMMSGYKRQGAFMKPYGNDRYPGWAKGEEMEDTGTRNHPVYPF